MTSTRNGNPSNRPTRRLRFDASTSRLINSPAVYRSPAHSGRRLVVVAVFSILILWGSLYLAFREWRTRFRERAVFGKQHVATAVDPLGRIVPDDIKPTEWQAAVRETHDMIVTLTGSNVLTLDDMKNLKSELTAHTARARPETARAELAAIWNDLRQRAGPIVNVNRHPLPKILSGAPTGQTESVGPGK